MQVSKLIVLTSHMFLFFYSLPESSIVYGQPRRYIDRCYRRHRLIFKLDLLTDFKGKLTVSISLSFILRSSV